MPQDSKVKTVLLIVFLWYMVSVFIAGICFSIGFFREHGFAVWSLSGERVRGGGFKTLFWPYYIWRRSSQHESEFSQWTEYDITNGKHFLSSIQADLESIELSIQRFNSSRPMSEIKAECLELKQTALSEAKLVDDSMLRKAHPDLPAQFRTLYQRGLELRISNLKSPNKDAELKGMALHDKWADWFNENSARIIIPKPTRERIRRF